MYVPYAIPCQINLHTDPLLLLLWIKEGAVERKLKRFDYILIEINTLKVFWLAYFPDFI